MSLFSFFTTVTVADEPPEALLTGNSDVHFSSLPLPGFIDTIRLTVIYVICRPGGPYWEKLCPRSWVRPRAALRTKGTVFPNTDRPRPPNNVFIFFSLENYFIRNIFVDFLLQQFHTVRVRLTFRSSKPVLFTEVFKRRDSVFADFKLSNKWFTFHGDF